HHLLGIKPLISAVAILGFSNLFALTLDVGAGQVIQQHIQLCLEQVLPALPQMLKQGWLALQNAIQRTIETILFCHRKVSPQPLSHRTLIAPLPVHAKLAAPVQAIDLPPAAATPSPRTAFLVAPSPLTFLPRTPPAAAVATAHSPASSCRRRAADATPSRWV